MPKSPSDKDAATPTAKEPNGDAVSAASPQAALAQAYKDIARGEQHAAALEASLTSLESKLDVLLASIENSAASSAVPQAKRDDRKKQEPEAKE
ncbi:hypothetical protein F4818DRAFT_90357 [Hypoxylon cercidicola]|nr:hypothetical protein F4818DRAFT_90357 [Hypoxylon cercidicola]